MRVAVALRLGLNICLPHPCKCGELVDSYGTHAFVCKFAQGRGARHAAVNDIVTRAFVSAGVPASKEPSGLTRGVGKRPDGITLIPWRNGKPLAWDATVSTPLAASYLSATSTAAGASAEISDTRKTLKYAYLAPDIAFQAVAMDTLGGVTSSTASFINDLGHRITNNSGDLVETAYLWQRLSVGLMRYNSVLLYQSFILDDRDPDE